MGKCRTVGMPPEPVAPRRRRRRPVRRLLPVLCAAVLTVAALVAIASIPRIDAGFSDTTANSGNSAAAATRFSPEYADTGSAASRTTSGTMEVAYPAGTTAGDLLFLVQFNNSDQAYVTPAGWTLLADAQAPAGPKPRLTLWWREAGGAGSVFHDVNADASGTTAWVVRYLPGASSPVPAAVAVSSGTAGAAATVTPSPDIVTSEPSATAISFVAVPAENALSLSVAQGFTLRQSATGSGNAVGLADVRIPVSGTTVPSPTWQQSGVAGEWLWATVAFT